MTAGVRHDDARTIMEDIMTIDKGCIVRSTAGRDKDNLFVVLAVDGTRATVVDGDLHRMDRPKSKNVKHLVFYAENNNPKLLGKILDGSRLEDAEVRKAIRMLQEEVL